MADAAGPSGSVTAEPGTGIKPAGSTKMVTPEELLEALSKVPADKATYASSNLHLQLIGQRAFLTGLAGLATVAPGDMTLTQLDALLCTFLKQVFNLVSATKGEG